MSVLLLALACLLYATKASPCDPPCVQGQCNTTATSCSCAKGWTGRQCTQDTGNCSPPTSLNCSGLITCEANKATACTPVPSDYIHVGSLGTQFMVTFEYSVRECNGILVHAKDSAHPGYYFVLELQDGTIRFTASCGTGEVALQSIPENDSDPSCLCSGQWQSVKVIKTQDVIYLQVTGGRTVTVTTHVNPSDLCVAGTNVTLFTGTMEDKATVGVAPSTSLDRQSYGYIRNLAIVSKLRRWMLLDQIEVQGSRPATPNPQGPGSYPSTKAEGSGGIMPWIFAGLGGVGMLICVCCAVNLALVSVQCYQRRSKKWNCNKKPPSQYPGSQVNLLPVLDIKDNPYQEDTDNPTTVTFTPVTRMPPYHIPNLHPQTLGYPHHDYNDGTPPNQKNMDAIRPISTELQTQYDSNLNRQDDGQGSEERSSTYQLNTTTTDSVLHRQYSSDNSNSI